MGRNKLTIDDKNQRVAIQSALFNAVSLKRLQQEKIELNLDIKNSAQDGSVWRKIGRGAQLLKMDTLIAMVLKAEQLKWCNANEILSADSQVNDMRDREIIHQRLEDWRGRVEDMTLLCSFGSPATKDQLIDIFETAIKRLKENR